MGYDALRKGIEQFAVRNRRNLYVCCDDNKRNVFYMQLFASEESFRKKRLHCDTTFIDEVSYQSSFNSLNFRAYKTAFYNSCVSLICGTSC